MKKLFLIISVASGLVGATHSGAQNLEIDFIQFTGRTVVVHYNLDDGASSNRQFLVQLFSSQDNFSVPLTRLSGDFGPEVSAGFDKKIVWDITQELGAFSGDISLELRGRVYVPFVKLTTPSEGAVFKRGKNYPINWTSGNLSGLVNIELFNAAGERMWGENNVSNVGKFDWFVPAGVKKGNDYQLKFTNAKDRNDVVLSKPFSIKPKIPLLVKIASVVVVGTAAQVLISTAQKNSQPKPLAGPPPAPN